MHFQMCCYITCTSLVGGGGCQQDECTNHLLHKYCLAGSMEHNLQDSDSQEIVELLSTASEKWRSIGLQLGLPNSTLNKVGELSNSDPVDRLSAVINEWLKMNGKEPTPKTLAEALKSESVQERKLAERVENKYGKESEVDSVTDGQSSSG